MRLDFSEQPAMREFYERHEPAEIEALHRSMGAPLLTFDAL